MKGAGWSSRDMYQKLAYQELKADSRVILYIHTQDLAKGEVSTNA
jgi:hypothetical protein